MSDKHKEHGQYFWVTSAPFHVIYGQLICSISALNDIGYHFIFFFLKQRNIEALFIPKINIHLLTT
jgi:hypothetical protein